MRHTTLRQRLIFFIVFLLAAGQPGFSQQNPSRAELERRRAGILADIQASQAQLAATKRDKNATLAQLSALQAKLDARQRLITNINTEINSLSSTIVYSQQEIDRLSKNLEVLKLRYAQSVRYAYRHRSSYATLAFVLSSSSFDDALRRMKYLKRYREYRERKVDEIRFTTARIAEQIGVLNTEKSRKDLLRAAEEQQRLALQAERNETNTVAAQLRGREKELLADIALKKKNAAQLKRTIDDIIRREIAAARKKAEEEAEARRIAAAKKAADDEAKRVAAAKAAAAAAAAKSNPGGVSVATGSGTRPAVGPVPDNPAPTTTTPASTTASTTPSPAPATSAPPAAPRTNPSSDPGRALALAPEAAALSAGFASNRGRLPWPVDKGAIISSFGKHQHPLYPKVFLENNGIDIQTAPGAAVHAVYDGEVTAVFYIPGVGQNVMIKHGEYFTVYTGLASASVRKGQDVKTRQALGTIGLNEDNIPVLKFLVYKGAAVMNPEGWIAR